MSDLQLSLFGLGAILVGGVWIYNKLQESKYRKEAEKIFATDQTEADVLAPAAMDVEPGAVLNEASREGAAVETTYGYAERQEPAIGVHGDSGDGDDGNNNNHESDWRDPSDRIDQGPPPAVPVEDRDEVLAGGRDANAQHAPPADWCDNSIDLIARLHFGTGVSADDLRQSQSTLQAHQRVHLRAFVELGPERWAPLAEAGNGTFGKVWFALQLVDRRGAVSTNDFEALRHSLQPLVSLRNGELVFPDVAAMGEQARALDEFCAQLDLQLALNVLDAGHGAFLGTKIRGMAEAAGMRLTGNGEFQAHDENGNFLFALANMGEPFETQSLKNMQTHGLTFLLDVPHVRDGGYAFERMLASARQFANTLNAALVNAQRAPVSDAMVETIRRKIFEIHEQMNLAGIPAGGVRALRLFS